MTTTTFAITKAMAAACKAYGNSVGMVGEKLEKLRAEFGPRMLERWTTLTTQESVPAKTASDQVCREVRQALTDQFGSQQNADTQRFMERQRALVDNIMTAERVASRNSDLLVSIETENGDTRKVPVGEALSVGALKRFSKDLADEKKRDATVEAIGERMSDREKPIAGKLSEGQAASLKGKLDAGNDTKPAKTRVRAAALAIEGILNRQHGDNSKTRMTEKEHDEELAFIEAIFKANRFEVTNGRKPVGQR